MPRQRFCNRCISQSPNWRLFYANFKISFAKFFYAFFFRIGLRFNKYFHIYLIPKSWTSKISVALGGIAFFIGFGNLYLLHAFCNVANQCIQVKSLAFLFTFRFLRIVVIVTLRIRQGKAKFDQFTVF